MSETKKVARQPPGVKTGIYKALSQNLLPPNFLLPAVNILPRYSSTKLMAPIKTFLAVLASCAVPALAIPNTFQGALESRSGCEAVANANWCNPKCNECKNGVQIRKSNKKLNVGTVDISTLMALMKQYCYKENSEYYGCPQTSHSVSTKYYVDPTSTTGGSVSVGFGGSILISQWDHAVTLLSTAVETDSSPKYICNCHNGNCPRTTALWRKDA